MAGSKEVRNKREHNLPAPREVTYPPEILDRIYGAETSIYVQMAKRYDSVVSDDRPAIIPTSPSLH